MEMIQERYVTFETAKMLFEKGFMWKHFTWRMKRNSDGEEYGFPEREATLGDAIPPILNTCYNDEGKEITPNYYNPKNKHYPRPTQSMVAEWILKKYNLFIQLEWTWDMEKNNIDAERYSVYTAHVRQVPRGKVVYVNDPTTDPIMAMEWGIQLALKSISL